MCIKLTAILILLLPFSAVAERLYGHFDPPKFQAQRIGLKYEMDYFDAVGNYLRNGGAPVDLSSNNSFSSVNAHMQADYDLSQKASMTFGLQLAHARSQDREFGRESSKLKGYFFGGAYKLKGFAGWSAVLDARYYITNSKTSLSKDRVSVGDGVNWYGGGIWLGRRLSKEMTVWAYSGVKFRGGGLSDLFLYSIRPEVKAGKFKFGLGLEGFISFSDDKFTNDPVPRLELISQLNGNSFRYRSLNPVYHEAQGWIGYKFKPYNEMRIGLAQPVAGENTASGLRIFLSLETSLGWNGGGLNFNFKPLRKKKYDKKKKDKGEKKGFFFKKKKRKKSPFRVN